VEETSFPGHQLAPNRRQYRRRRSRAPDVGVFPAFFGFPVGRLSADLSRHFVKSDDDDGGSGHGGPEHPAGLASGGHCLLPARVGVRGVTCVSRDIGSVERRRVTSLTSAIDRSTLLQLQQSVSQSVSQAL